MAEIAAVQASQPDANAGKPKPKSAIGFPYFSLDRSIEVARVIHERAGGRCDRAQLASLLGYSGVKNGGFLTRLSAAKMFGLVEVAGESVALTDRAKKVISPVRDSDAARAKLDSFFEVELFRRVYEDNEGHSLPHEVGLKNKFVNDYKIVPNQVDTALRTLMESAQSAGMFDLHGNRSRMILPIIADAAKPARDLPPAADQAASESGGKSAQESGKTGGGGGGGGEPPNVHPALMGLIQTLPPVGATLGPKRRAALIEAFKSTINFLYPEDEEPAP